MLGGEAGGAVGRYRQVCVMMVVAGVEGFTCTRTTHHLAQEQLRRRVDNSDIQKLQKQHIPKIGKVPLFGNENVYTN